LQNNTGGSENTAIGDNTLLGNTLGWSNTALGERALANSNGDRNTATGTDSLRNNTGGNNNTATGMQALTANTTGSNNTAFGRFALATNTIGNGNTAIGSSAGVSSGDLSNATAIGGGALVDASNKIRLGNASVTVIEGQVAYTFTSDKTKKENFQAVDGESVLVKLRDIPLTSWNYIGQDRLQFRHYGPMAQDFFAAFGHDNIGVIGTPTTLNSGDLSGILMVAVQALEQHTIELQQKEAQLAAREAQLEAKLARLEALLQKK